MMDAVFDFIITAVFVLKVASTVFTFIITVLITANLVIIVLVLILVLALVLFYFFFGIIIATNVSIVCGNFCLFTAYERVRGVSKREA